MVSSLSILSLFAAAIVPFVAAHPDSRENHAPQPVPNTSTYLAILVKKTTGNTIYSLSCNPDGGSHPRPQAACEFLQSINGNFNGLPASQILCTLEYNPVNVTILGLYQGRFTVFNNQYSNECFAIGALGNLYPTTV
ncbi:subtilisin inhibitor [Choanephora cucurbitarum]|nr:subtilisin inhibitor [Choanephora cucurbitarum]